MKQKQPPKEAFRTASELQKTTRNILGLSSPDSDVIGQVPGDHLLRTCSETKCITLGGRLPI
jgi:hypothetical protein